MKNPHKPEFPRCKKHGCIYLDKKHGCPRCRSDAHQRSKGLCTSLLYHGPGHQSSTYCQVVGKHEIRFGRKVHRAIYGSFEQEMEWIERRGKKTFTGYFDDPVELTKPKKDDKVRS